MRCGFILFRKSAAAALIPGTAEPLATSENESVPVSRSRTGRRSAAAAAADDGQCRDDAPGRPVASCFAHLQPVHYSHTPPSSRPLWHKR